MVLPPAFTPHSCKAHCAIASDSLYLGKGTWHQERLSLICGVRWRGEAGHGTSIILLKAYQLLILANILTVGHLWMSSNRHTEIVVAQTPWHCGVWLLLDIGDGGGFGKLSAYLPFIDTATFSLVRKCNFGLVHDPVLILRNHHRPVIDDN